MKNELVKEAILRLEDDALNADNQAKFHEELASNNRAKALAFRAAAKLLRQKDDTSQPKEPRK